MIEEVFLHSPFHDGDLRYIYQMRNRTFTGSLWNELALVWNWQAMIEEVILHFLFVNGEVRCIWLEINR